MLENMKRWGIPDITDEAKPRTPQEEVALLPFCTRMSRQPKQGLPSIKIISLLSSQEKKDKGITEDYVQNKTGRILRDLSEGRKQGIDAKLKFIMPYGDILLNEEVTELVETKYLARLLRAGYNIEAW